MTAGGKTAARGNFFNGWAGGGKQLPGKGKAVQNQIPLRRKTGPVFKGVGKVRFADEKILGQIADGQLFIQMLVDIALDIQNHRVQLLNGLQEISL